MRPGAGLPDATRLGRHHSADPVVHSSAGGLGLLPGSWNPKVVGSFPATAIISPVAAIAVVNQARLLN
jgi:hypothetical protein